MLRQRSKTSDEEFLLTLLNNVKIDHEAAANALEINKAACRMRFIRLQQKYGFKKKGKGIPRHKQAFAMTDDAEKENPHLPDPPISTTRERTIAIKQSLSNL
ncbi:uncharacterized protein N7487_001126 [Penicillium crustosum]|uniref:uncharacterized protein n=1 Tax=Penicillium crustosum TaxID=36656 RepID=UPI0023A669F6|nr:uncharacterized protein N7487_001126 [Penicillium crustosum]KAJ5417576.1 hypothetical protein N7487_001126 [Penicillium crustosum]